MANEDLYRTVHKWLGHFKGGLAMATVAACACFAAISGSSLATAATLGKVAMPEMKKYKYDTALATGSIAAGGSIGILIPPSVILIIYGIITEHSIGKLFLAGFVPGVLEAIFYILAIIIMTKKDRSLVLQGPDQPQETGSCRCSKHGRSLFYLSLLSVEFIRVFLLPRRLPVLEPLELSPSHFYAEK